LKIFSAVPDLLENLGNPNSAVRRSAADALGVVGDTRAVLKLEKLLNDTDKSVAGAAKKAIEKIKAKPATEKIQEQPQVQPDKQAKGQPKN
jgi:HEAT repeat protein